MRHVDEYRDPRLARALIDRIRRRTTRPWTIMEVCGGQTHALVREGIDQLLPDELELVHGPGCPVCVTPPEIIDHALDIAAQPDVILCSFGDMVRVPGSSGDLQRARAAGADVRVVYSPLDAVDIARARPDRTVVFFAVGFETTAPTTAFAALEARRLGLRNFMLLVAHVRVPPALESLLASPENRVQGLLAPGHVCTVEGQADYEAIATRFGVPIVITGFEPVDLLEGISMCIAQLETGSARVENQYQRSARPAGNPHARQAVNEVFEIADRPWRGLGILAGGGLRLRDTYRDFDAAVHFPPAIHTEADNGRCLAALVLQGRLRPDACPEFARSCNPDHPLGAPMVSNEGACAAYFLAGRQPTPQP